MTDRFLDSQGGERDRPLVNDIGGGCVPMSPEDEAEYQSRQARALRIADRFQELAAADGDYWPAVDMIRITRYVLRDMDRAHNWQMLVEAKRRRFYDEIEREMNNE